MHRLLIIAVLLASTPVVAEEVRLNGPEIEALLPKIIAHGTVKDTRQKFWPDGHTEFEEQGRYSFGRWWVDNDNYCSKWPPSEAVSCYGVAQDGERLIWLPRQGDRIVDHISVRPLKVQE